MRLLERSDGWAVLAQIDLAEMRVYSIREQAEDVCGRLMEADGDAWREVQLPAQWWA